MISPSLFSSQLLGEIRSNKIALAAWIRLNPIPDGRLFYGLLGYYWGLEWPNHKNKAIFVPYNSKILK